MSPPSGQDRPDLIDHLRACPESFEFLQALRLLCAASAGDAGAHSGPGGDDLAAPGVRLATAPSLAYPATELAWREPGTGHYDGGNGNGEGEDERAPRTVWMNFLGLHGPTGVLPTFVTQAAEGSASLARVLDYFNHELALAYARCARAARVDLTVEAAWARATRGGDGADDFTRALLGIAGTHLGRTGRGAGPRTRAEDLSVVRYFAAAWRNGPMALTSLRAMLEALLRLPVDVLPFEPVWTEVDAASRLRLGGRGRGLVLGSRTRSVQGGVRVRIGPLDYPTFRRLLPGRRSLGRLGRLLRAALGPWTEVVIQPVLKREQVPNWRLGRDGDVGRDAGVARQPRLGRSLFLRGRDPRPYPADFDRLKVTAAAIRRAGRRAHGEASGPAAAPGRIGSEAS